MTTSSTTDTLITVIARLTSAESLVPQANSTVTNAMISSAPQSSEIPPRSAVPPPNPNTVPR